ncbi:MAG TPA: hypothetical protein VK574_14000 [Terracidiphilus sp.]|nr:hypothetical protein [Terracidiphilus sp.]
MKTAVAAVLLLLSSISLVAQNAARPEDQVLLLKASQMANGCPIGMIANQGVWDHTLRVRQGQREKAQPFGQRILLTLSDANSATIIAATVRVNGLTGKNRVVQTAPGAAAAGEATKTIKVNFAVSQKGGVTGDLYIPGFTAVNSIELIQVSYEDGRVWRIGADSVCRVTPDPMMLIANH